MYLHKDNETFTNGPAILGDHVSILLCGHLETPTNDTIEKDSYFVSFVSHSGLLKFRYSERVVSNMRSLYINLNEIVTQNECTIFNGIQVSDYNPLSKYGNTPSNISVVYLVVSTTYDPLSEDDNDKTDNEEDENFCPLHREGYKRINYSTTNFLVTKNIGCHPCINSTKKLQISNCQFCIPFKYNLNN